MSEEMIRSTALDHWVSLYMDQPAIQADSDPSRFEPAIRRDGIRFINALLSRLPDLDIDSVKLAIDLLYCIEDHVGDPHDWDEISTVVDLLDFMAQRRVSK